MGYNSKYTGSDVELLLEKAGTAIQEHQDISGKQDVISDLDAIREGASMGATALQSVPSEYVTETELANKGYATTSSVNTALEGKVDKVNGKGLSTNDFTTALKTKLEGLINYDDAAIQQAVAGLQTQLNTLVSGDAASAIESFNEIIAFLDGVEDTETLDGIIASIEQQIAAKYTKPSTGIPKGDLADAVQASLGKADTALQSYTETDPTVPSWAKAASKPTYTASEVGAVPTTRKVNGKALSADITLSASDVSALPNTTVIPTKVSELTNDSNFTSNTGTITGVTMNGTSKGTGGVVDLGTVITEHQDISGKQDKLVSGTNIKTVNGESLLGSGDIVIEGGDGDYLPLTGGTITGNLTVNDSLYAEQVLTDMTRSKSYRDCYLLLDRYGFDYISPDGNISFNTLGDGTTFLSNDGSYKAVSNTTPVVSHGTSDTSFALTPNVFHKWGTVSSLSLTLATPSDSTLLNEYIFQFTSGSTATSLTLPSTVKWAVEPAIEPNKTYQISILDGLGVIGGF